MSTNLDACYGCAFGMRMPAGIVMRQWWPSVVTGATWPRDCLPPHPPTACRDLRSDKNHGSYPALM